MHHLESNSPVTIQITENLEQLWNQLGLDAKMRNEQMNQMKEKCEKIFNDNLVLLNQQCNNTKEKIKQLQNKHKQAMAAYGIPETEIYSSFKPIEDTNLLAQLAAAEKEYEQFRIKITEQIQKIENFVLICKESFEALETPPEDRGEYASVGETDFTRERIERFRIKVEELHKEINARASQIKSTKNRIISALNMISDYATPEINALLNKDKVGNSYIKALDDLEKNVMKEKESRLQQLNDLALDITNSWDTLNTPQEERDEFLKQYNNLSLKTLEDCRKEIIRLKQKENEILPKLLEGKRKELANLYAALHISLESRAHFDKTACKEDDILHAEYQFLSEEIIRLKKIQDKYHPILVEINKRETIIEDYQYVCSIQNDPRRLTSRGPGMGQQLMKEEKARQRYKFTLPHVEQKLYQLLTDYFKENNTHFEWDGQPYIEKLSQENIAKAASNETKKAKTLPKKPKMPLHPNQNYNPNAKVMSMKF